MLTSHSPRPLSLSLCGYSFCESRAVSLLVFPVFYSTTSQRTLLVKINNAITGIDRTAHLQLSRIPPRTSPIFHDIACLLISKRYQGFDDDLLVFPFCFSFTFPDNVTFSSSPASSPAHQDSCLLHHLVLPQLHPSLVTPNLAFNTTFNTKGTKVQTCLSPPPQSPGLPPSHYPPSPSTSRLLSQGEVVFSQTVSLVQTREIDI